MNAPREGQIVNVHGGTAQYRSGVFYSGVAEPRYTRPIQWPVEWWTPDVCDCGHPYAEHNIKWAFGLECFACSECACPEYSGPSPE